MMTVAIKGPLRQAPEGRAAFVDWVVCVATALKIEG